MAALAREAGLLQQVMGDEIDDPEQFLEQLFRARHELLVVQTMAGQSREVYGRMAAALVRVIPREAQPLVAHLAGQLERVRGLADGEKDFLHGVIEFYQTRTDTKMTIAAERLAVIAAVTLPITGLSSIYGINVIVNDRTRYLQLAVLLAVMAVMSAALLRWTKQQGWWEPALDRGPKCKSIAGPGVRPCGNGREPMATRTGV